MDKRTAIKSILNGIYNIAALLAHRGNVTANSTEGLSSPPSSKGAGDFLFDLDHSDITFGQIVVKRDAKVIHKSQDLGFVFVQTV